MTPRAWVYGIAWACVAWGLLVLSYWAGEAIR